MYTPAQAYQPGKNLDSTTAILVAMKEKGTLQSYVAQHRNSPEYPMLLSLAATINKVSDATTAARNQPPQQTVADQQLSALAPAPAPQPMMQLPEDSGIAQLPTENIEGMAGGGIVAFDEGGHVPRYNGNTTDGSQVASSPFGNIMSSVGNWFSRVGNPATNPRAQLSTLQAEKARAEQGFFEALTPQQKAERSAQVQQLDAKIKEVQSSLSGPKPFEAPVSTSAGPSPSNEDIEKNILGITGGDAKATTSAGSAKSSRPPAAGAPKPGFESVDAYSKQLMGIDSLLPAKEKAKDRATFMTEREEIGKPYYDKAMKMVESEKSKLKDDREQSFYMSLIEGGLAAAGGTSQYGLQNLAQGFAKGSASFGDALKDLRKAARENSKMEVEIERMKAADKRGDMDAYQKHEDSVRESNAKIDQLKTSGIFGLMGDKMRADATVRAAGIAASAPSAQERLFATLGGGDVTKGFKVFQEAQQDKTGASYAKLYSDYAANADKTGADKMSPIEFAQNIQMFMGALGGGGFQSKPGDTTVRKLP
jgi:hypothetical protein